MAIIETENTIVKGDASVRISESGYIVIEIHKTDYLIANIALSPLEANHISSGLRDAFDAIKIELGA